MNSFSEENLFNSFLDSVTRNHTRSKYFIGSTSYGTCTWEINDIRCMKFITIGIKNCRIYEIKSKTYGIKKVDCWPKFNLDRFNPIDFSTYNADVHSRTLIHEYESMMHHEFTWCISGDIDQFISDSIQINFQLSF